MWPVSCASTPMIWFGVLASISAPALTKMRRPSITKALNDAVVDDDDVDVLLRETGGAQDRLRVVAQQLLDLGVADQRNAARQALRARRRDATSATAIANAVSSASARAAGVRRRALIGLSAFGHVRSGSRAQCSANLVAPPGRVNAGPDHVSVARLVPERRAVRSGRMRQQRGRALTRRRMRRGEPP